MMSTVRAAARELLQVGVMVASGDPGGEPAGQAPPRRGPLWLVTQVVIAAVTLGAALAVRHLLRSAGISGGPRLVWLVPAVLLVLPFVTHLLARPVRPVLGATLAALVASAVAWAAALLALAVALPLLTVVYVSAVPAAIVAAAVFGRLSPAVVRPLAAD